MLSTTDFVELWHFYLILPAKVRSTASEIERGEAMIGWVQIVLLTIGLAGFVVAFVSWEIYVREGGVPTRPWFHAQRTPRERQLAKRSRAGVWVFGVSVGLLLLDIAHKQ